MNEVEKVVPKITDRYWFEWSEKVVSRAIESREEAAAKLQGLALWLWGIYTTFAAAGLALAQKGLPTNIAVIVGLTSAFLIGLYWCTVWVQIPVSLVFDPRSPTEIKAAHLTSVKVKNDRLKFTLVVSLFAAILVTTSLILIGARTTDDFKLHITSAEVDQKEILAFLCESPLFAERVVLSLEKNEADKKYSTYYKAVYIPSANRIQGNIPLPRTENDFRLVVSWEDKDGIGHQILKHVKHKGLVSK